MRPTALLLRVILSDTNSDLYDYRTKVIAGINKTGEKVVDMRYFSSQVESAAAVSVTNAAEADVVVLLIGWCYGSVDPEQTVSYTHLEYREATRLQKPILVFLAAEDAVGLTLPDPLDPRLVALRAEVSNGTHVVDMYHSPDELATLVVAALYTYYRQRFPPEVGDRVGEGRMLSNLENLAYSQGRYAEAAEYYTQRLVIAREVGDRAGEGRVLGNLGNLAMEQGRYAEAAEYYAQRLAIAREVGDRAGEGGVLGNLGVLAYSQGRYVEAADYYAQCLAIAREVGDRAGKGRVLGNLGNLARNQARYVEAADYYDQHLAIAREVGDRDSEGGVLNNLGLLARNQGRYAEAAEYYAQCLVIARELGDRNGEGITLNNLGSLAAGRGRYAEAADYYARSLALLVPMKHRAVVQIQRNVDKLHKVMGEHRDASVERLSEDVGRDTPTP